MMDTYNSLYPIFLNFTTIDILTILMKSSILLMIVVQLPTVPTENSSYVCEKQN